MNYNLRKLWEIVKDREVWCAAVLEFAELEGLMLKLNLQYFGNLMRRTNSIEKTLMLGKSEGRRRRGHSLIPACTSPSPAFHMMYSAYKLNKQGDNI